jgi:fumarate hydratase subunit beta
MGENNSMTPQMTSTPSMPEDTPPRRIKLPLTPDGVRDLKLGEHILLDGEIVATAGLPTHMRMLEFIDRGEALPIDLNGGAFFHLGSYNRESETGFEVLYVNPTTSTRFNALMPTLIRSLDLRMVGGKGGLDRGCAEAMRENGCVYLSFLGGGAPLHSAAIEDVVDVAWHDLVSHYRLVKFRVSGLGPLVVAIDAHGNSLYDQLQRQAEDRLPALMAELAAARNAT